MENSFQRSWEILSLFTEERVLIEVRDVIERFGYTKSSTYRYVNNLVAAGMLAAVGNGLYSLGPKIIELERLIVLSDPLLTAGRRLMAEIAEPIPDSALLLCSLWGERVLCIHEVRSAAREGTTQAFVPRRGRGIPYTLFEGAASLVILAHLPAFKLRSIFRRNIAEIAAKGLGEDWSGFATRLRTIRQDGHSTTVDSFHTGRVSVAVPVADAGGRLLGSLAVVQAMTVDGTASAELTGELKSGARAIGSAASSMIQSHSSATPNEGQGASIYRSIEPV